ncbi:MAG: hypothetical protein H7146_08560 [Burkholderiaceae bacterium]|nr:hypothetical protein [Microbacteriaceae bacterium]
MNGQLDRATLAVDIWNIAKWPRVIIVDVLATHGFAFTVASESWHVHHDGAVQETTPALSGSTQITGDLDTFCAILGIPDAKLSPGVKYFG